MNMEKIFTQGLLNTYKLTVREADLNQKIVAELARIARKVKMPGFRPGKVPFSIVSQRYQSEAVESVVNDFISEALKIIKKELKHVASEPEIAVNSFEEGKDFVCTITVQATPTFNPDMIDELPFERLTLEYPEGYFDALLGSIQKLFCSMIPLESPRPAQKGDVVQVAIQTGNEPKEEKIVSFIVEKSAAFSENDLNLFIGKNIGDSLELLESDVLYAGQWGIYAPRHFSKANQDAWHELSSLIQDHKNHRDEQKALLAKESDSSDLEKESSTEIVEKKEELPEISFVVKAIGILSDSPSTEELNTFCQYIDAESFDAFIEEKKAIATQYLSTAMDLYNSRRLMDLLNEYFVFDVPEPLVQKEFEVIWDFFQSEYKKAQANGDLSAEDLEKSEEDFQKEYMEIAERRVRLGYLMRALAAKHDISLSRHEMLSLLMKQLNNAGISESEFDKMFQEDKEIVNRILMPYMERKILNFIFQRSVKTERSILPETLIEESLEMIPFSPDAEAELNAYVDALSSVASEIYSFDLRSSEEATPQLESMKEESPQAQPALSSETTQEGTV